MKLIFLKNRIKFTVLLLIVFLGVMVSIFLFQQHLIEKNKVPVNSFTLLKSALWPTYEDKELGISFKYPTKDIDGRIIIFRINDVLFVTPETSKVYLQKNELNQLAGKALLDKAQEIDDYGYWAIWVNEASSDSDIEKVIQKKFSEFKGGCTFGGLTQWGTADMFNVEVSPADGNYDLDGSCGVNERVALLYSPSEKRIAIWNMGQAYQFFLSLPAKDNDTADDIMLNSFKFTDAK